MNLLYPIGSYSEARPFWAAISDLTAAAETFLIRLNRKY